MNKINKIRFNVSECESLVFLSLSISEPHNLPFASEEIQSPFSIGLFAYAKRICTQFSVRIYLV